MYLPRTSGLSKRIVIQAAEAGIKNSEETEDCGHKSNTRNKPATRRRQLKVRRNLADLQKRQRVILLLCEDWGVVFETKRGRN